jgi:hypothetical protein
MGNQECKVRAEWAEPEELAGLLCAGVRACAGIQADPLVAVTAQISDRTAQILARTGI